MTEFERTLMNRDGLSREEAREELIAAREDFYALVDDGASYSEVEEMMLDEYGLEMDYLMDFI